MQSLWVPWSFLSLAHSLNPPTMIRYPHRQADEGTLSTVPGRHNEVETHITASTARSDSVAPWPRIRTRSCRRVHESLTPYVQDAILWDAHV